MLIRWLKKVLIVTSGPAILILVWYLFSRFGNYQSALLPGPADVIKGLYEIYASGFLAESIKVSLLRFAAGYILAAVSGIVLGLILGRITILWRIINPVVQLLRPIAPVAWFPFIVLFFGIGNLPAVVIIFIAGFFPVLLSTVSAVSSIDPMILKVAKNFGIKYPALLYKIIFPAVFPTVMIGLHLALGTSWIFLVAGEMVGAQSGLGFIIIDARNNLRADLVLAGIIVIGALGLAIDRGVMIIERQVGAHWGIPSARKEQR